MVQTEEISAKSNQFLQDYSKFAKNPTIKVARRLLGRLRNMSVSQLAEISQGAKFGEQRIHVGSVVFSKVREASASKLTGILADMHSIVAPHRRDDSPSGKKQERQTPVIQ